MSAIQAQEKTNKFRAVQMFHLLKTAGYGTDEALWLTLAQTIVEKPMFFEPNEDVLSND